MPRCTCQPPPRPHPISVIRVVAGQWTVIRNGRKVYTHPIRTAVEQWVLRNPA